MKKQWHKVEFYTDEPDKAVARVIDIENQFKVTDIRVFSLDTWYPLTHIESEIITNSTEKK